MNQQIVFIGFFGILYLEQVIHFPQILGLFTLIGMFCGFSLSALLTSLIYNHIFKKFDLYQLQEHLASKIALYQLYYIYDFSSWKEAFHYIGSL